MTRRTIAGVPLLAALVLAGCGDNRSAETKAMDTKFERIDYKMSTLETVNAVYNRSYLEQATQQYIALVRRYAGVLGRDEATRRLSEKADELRSYCIPCVATLEDEAKRY